MPNSTLDQQDRNGRTPLHNAVINKQHEQMIKLLRGGANPNVRDSMGRGGFTPMYYAISQTRDPLSVKILKAARAEVDQSLMTELERQSKADPINRDLRDIRKALGVFSAPAKPNK